VRRIDEPKEWGSLLARPVCKASIRRNQLDELSAAHYLHAVFQHGSLHAELTAAVRYRRQHARRATQVGAVHEAIIHQKQAVNIK
jgi:hypothetical protein